MGELKMKGGVASWVWKSTWGKRREREREISRGTESEIVCDLGEKRGNT